MVLLRKGWSTWAIARVNRVSPSSIERVHKNQLPHLKTSVASKPYKIIDTMMKTCIRAIMIGRHNTATIVAKVVREQFGCSIRDSNSEMGIKFYRFIKKKKPLLREKNIATCLEFALAHKHWTINN